MVYAIIELMILFVALVVILFLLLLLTYRLIYKLNCKFIGKGEVIAELKALKIFEAVVKTKWTGSGKKIHKNKKKK